MENGENNKIGFVLQIELLGVCTLENGETEIYKFKDVLSAMSNEIKEEFPDLNRELQNVTNANELIEFYYKGDALVEFLDWSISKPYIIKFEEGK